MSEHAAMALEAERAWLSLCNTHGPRTLYMTGNFKLRWAASHIRPVDQAEVGTYTRNVRWVDFRADVFHIFEQMTTRRRA